MRLLHKGADTIHWLEMRFVKFMHMRYIRANRIITFIVRFGEFNAWAYRFVQRAT